MSEESTIPGKTNVFLFVLIALLIATIIGSIGVFLLLGDKPPHEKSTVSRSATTSTLPTAPPMSGKAPTSFAEVSDANIPGRYKIDDGGKVMYVVLNEDHTFINQDGTTYPPYLWVISPEGFTITWQRSSSTWNVFETATVYSRTKSDGTVSRMEKLPDLPAADLFSISEKDATASMSLTSIIQTNGLSPANLDGDGAIALGEAGGKECHHLIRRRSLMSAFLYVRIAPELKATPFTNALVTVEYFDSPARDPRNGWISLQYDARDGPYTSTAQRVKLTGTMKWTSATFVLDAPLLQGAETDGADFRLCVANPDLSVRAIRLVKNAPVNRFVTKAGQAG